MLALIHLYGLPLLILKQEGYAAKYKTDENYGDPGRDGESDRRAGDAMQGLEGLDVAGPQLK